jgi:hypothetical protein
MCAAVEDNLDDSLEDFLGDFQLNAVPAPGSLPVEPENLLHSEPCPKCRGTGRFTSYAGRTLGECFNCKGKGKLFFKQSAEERAAARASKARRKEMIVSSWGEEHAAEHTWMLAAAARGFDFATNMIEAIKKFGHLTERQLAAVQKCMESDARRLTEAETRKTTAKVVDIAVIEQSFARAMERGVKAPKLRLDGFRFSPAKATSTNAGAIYVKDIESDEYLGKIVAAKFQRVRACTPEMEERIIAAAADPAAAATAYGQRTGCCSVCGRVLTKAQSVDRAIGPICADNYGF